MNAGLLLNSLLVAGGAGIAAITVGFCAAIGLICLDEKKQRWALACVGISLVVPPFTAVNCWLDLLGPNGALASILPAWIQIYSLPGTIWVLTWLLWPVACLLTWSSWQCINADLLDSMPSMRGGLLLTGLLCPMARRFWRVAFAVIFVLALNNFAVPAILQVKVLPAEIWMEFNTRLDNWAAIKTGWPLLVSSVLLVIGISRMADFQWPAAGSQYPASQIRDRLGMFWHAGGLGVLLMAAACSLAIPMSELLLKSRTWLEMLPSMQAGFVAIWNSFYLSALTAGCVVALGLMAGMVRYSSPVLRLLMQATWIPFIFPGVLLGVVLIASLNNRFTEFVYSSSWIMLIALTVRYLAPGINGMAWAIRNSDQDLVDAARDCGAHGWKLLWCGVWPLISKKAFLMGYIVYLLCLWDVESLVLIQPPGGETVAIKIFNLLHYGHTDQVNALCVWLGILALLPLVFWYSVGHLKTMLPRLFHGFDSSKISRGIFLVALAIMAGGCERSGTTNTARVESQFFDRVLIIGSRGNGLDQFSKPRSVAVDRQDNIYAVDMTGRVRKFSSEGQYLLSWQMPETDLGKAKGLGLDQEGNIIVIEPHYQRINHFDPEGRLVRQWGAKGTNIGEFILPRSVAVAANGDFFISEYTAVDRVQVFSARDKKLLLAWGQSGAALGCFNRPEGLGIDSQDRIYVADSCNHRIQVFNRNGKLIRAYGTPGTGLGQLSYPYDIRVDAEGRQYVCEFGNSRIQVFDSQDRPLEIIGGPGIGPGKFNNPWGIALDSQGNLIVADAGNHRLQKLIRKKKG